MHGAELGTLAGEAEAAVTYVRQWITLGPSGGGIFVGVAAATEKAHATLVANYARLDDLIASVRDRLIRAADAYEATDRMSSAEVLRSSPPHQ